MSEQIPESIPTSQDPRSRRTVKKRALTPNSAHASQVEALFSHPERDIALPPSATSNGKPRNAALPPEIVANVQGSSAGAGSGEFHVYKASRRREYERLRTMDEEVKKEKEAEEFERKNAELKKRDEARTNKNRARREKLKARKQGGKGEVQKDGKAGVPTNGVDLEAGRLPLEKDGRPTNGEMEDVGTDAPAAYEGVGVIIHDDD